MGLEAQNICLLAVNIGQRRPSQEPLDICKVAGKLYRSAAGMRNTGNISAGFPFAQKLADSVGGTFEVVSNHADIECFIIYDGEKVRVI
jgi:hypothetical protein